MGDHTHSAKRLRQEMLDAGNAQVFEPIPDEAGVEALLIGGNATKAPSSLMTAEVPTPTPSSGNPWDAD
jgi:hypothetical protein